jgi:hypothetical protein
MLLVLQFVWDFSLSFEHGHVLSIYPSFYFTTPEDIPDTISFFIKSREKRIHVGFFIRIVIDLTDVIQPPEAVVSLPVIEQETLLEHISAIGRQH